MKKIYITIINILLFLFLTQLFSGILRINNGTNWDKIIAGFVFALLIVLIPNFLKFFKLSVNNGALFLMSLLTSFLYFFAGVYLVGFIRIVGTTLDFGIPLISATRLTDDTVALIVITVVAAVFSTGLEILRENHS